MKVLICRSHYINLVDDGIKSNKTQNFIQNIQYVPSFIGEYLKIYGIRSAEFQTETSPVKIFCLNSNINCPEFHGLIQICNKFIPHKLLIMFTK